MSSSKWRLSEAHPPSTIPYRKPQLFFFCALASVFALLACNLRFTSTENPDSRTQRIPLNAQHILSKCMALRAFPGPLQDFSTRTESDRFEPGTNATLIRNATIWTGERNGTVVIQGNLLLDKGIVKNLGNVPEYLIDDTRNLTVIDANGAWVTPGLIDLHSHSGVLSIPLMAGAFDASSRKGPILPWLRSIDGFNTHDEAFQLAIAGGITTIQALPGSGNAIGGQAFMMKLRKTSEGSPSSMIIEPPYALNGTDPRSSLPFRWRYMTQTCGESLIRYGSRMDTIWALRSAYDEARKAKQAQDIYCSKAEAGLWESIEGGFPENLQWEMLVDVLRGRVKITNHCYEAVDLDDLVRLTNEFQFPIASFHHASEAWLVPDVLKRTWGGTPTVAISATKHRVKREAYRGSEFAGRVLTDAGIPVALKSDVNSRYVLHEAQQAHYFSLPPHLALASVTTVPATAVGLSHRIGILSEGADADVVLWDSHPLQLGATPVNVWIDGVMQIPVPLKAGGTRNVVVGKGKEGQEWREVPDVPNWDEERERAIDWEGLPPLDGRKEDGIVVFRNVKDVWTRGNSGDIEMAFSALDQGDMGTVVVESGKIVCLGSAATCLTSTQASDGIDLHGGSLSPGLMSFGSLLGLEEIAREPSTGDGELYNAFTRDVPNILGDAAGMVRAMDALMFGTRNALIAYRSGVTLGTSSLTKTVFSGSSRVISGLSTTFRTGSAHAMERGAIVQDIAALHVAIGKPHPLSRKEGISVSEQISGLRRLLLGWESTDTDTGIWFKRAAEGVVPLVIEVGSADIMASLLILKGEIEDKKGSSMRMVFAGAMEAHILAGEISKAGVGVILNPSRPFPATWDDRRILAGPPLSNDTALVKLLENGVTVGLGVREAWAAQNARFDVSWAALESNGRINEQQAYALASTNLEKLLGVRAVGAETADLVAYDGGSAFDLSSKVVAVLSPERALVDFF